MRLSDLTFQTHYDSANEDVISLFFHPALSCSLTFDRATLPFNIDGLSSSAIGLEGLTERGGKARLLFVRDLPEKDYERLKKGTLSEAECNLLLRSEIETSAPSLELLNLGYMLEEDFLDIRILFSAKGGYDDSLAIASDGLNSLALKIQPNSDGKGQSFDLFRSWKKEENPTVVEQKSSFETLWNGQGSEGIVRPLPPAIKAVLTSYSRGRCFFSESHTEDRLFFKLGSQKELLVENTLANPAVFSEKSSFFVNHFKPWISAQKEGLTTFQKSLSIPVMESLILDGEKMGMAFGISVDVDPLLRAYLNLHHVNMENAMNLGIAIKRRSPLIVPSFTEFASSLQPLLGRPLKEPQLWDAFHIVNMRRSANFSVPGAGKTSTVLGAFAYLSERRIVKRILVIGPLNCFRAWKNESALCFQGKRDIQIFDFHAAHKADAAERHDRLIYDGKSADIILVNYEATTTNFETLLELIDDETMLVFDEVHRVKKFDGKRGEIARAFASKGTANYCVVLTGTPIPNGFTDTMNFLNILFPSEYDDYFGFTYSDMVVANRDHFQAQEISERMFPFFCLTTKEDLHVPPADPPDYSTGYCLADTKDEQLAALLYERYATNRLVLCIRLIQASSNPSLLLNDFDPALFDTFYDPDDPESSSQDFSSLLGPKDKEPTYFSKEAKEFISNFGMGKKFYRGIDIIAKETSSGESVVAWTVFVDTMYKLRAELKKRGISAEVINGRIPLEEREQLLDGFQRHLFQVLITNPATLGESVSLHTVCHVAVYFEYSFNLVHMLQSKDRIHRLGLKEGQRTHYYYLILDNPSSTSQYIDMHILRMLDRKTALQNDAITKDTIEYQPIDLKAEIENLVK